MTRHLITLVVILATLAPFTASRGIPDAPATGPDTASLERAVRAFSATTKVDGDGWEAYASFLHEGFTRWFVGRPVVLKSELVSQIRTWWDVGMRVGAEDSKIIRLDVVADVGIVRVERTEHYVDRDGNDAGEFHGFVMQTWKHEKGTWRLLSLDIAPAPEEDVSL